MELRRDVRCKGGRRIVRGWGVREIFCTIPRKEGGADVGGKKKVDGPGGSETSSSG